MAQNGPVLGMHVSPFASLAVIAHAPRERMPESPKRLPIERADIEALGFEGAEVDVVADHAVVDARGRLDPAATAASVRRAEAFFAGQLDEVRAFKRGWGGGSYDELTDRFDEYLEAKRIRAEVARRLEALPAPGSRAIPGLDPQVLFWGADLSGRDLRGRVLDGLTFVGCDFRGALIGESELSFGRAGGAKGAVFRRCDFRRAKLTNLKLDETTFEDCRFFGAEGQPWIEGPFEMIDPDMSERGDGSDRRDPGWV